MTMIGVTQPDHILQGIFCCPLCQRKVETRERHYLKKAKKANNIFKAQLQRLQHLEDNRFAKNQCVMGSQDQKIDAQGISAVQEYEMAASDRRAQKHLEDEG